MKFNPWGNVAAIDPINLASAAGSGLAAPPPAMGSIVRLAGLRHGGVFKLILCRRRPRTWPATPGTGEALKPSQLDAVLLAAEHAGAGPFRHPERRMALSRPPGWVVELGQRNLSRMPARPLSRRPRSTILKLGGCRGLQQHQAWRGSQRCSPYSWGVRLEPGR